MAEGNHAAVNQGYGFEPLQFDLDQREFSGRPPKKHPWFPPYRDLARWRKTQPWFAAEWKVARQMQAEWLMQNALDIQKNATKETAHLCRVKFDIIKYIASRLHPEVWGDRPAASPNISTTVQIGVISPERLADTP